MKIVANVKVVLCLKELSSDLLIVESQEKSISIEQIRQLINFSLKPILASLKIAIIDEAEKLTVEAEFFIKNSQNHIL